MTLKVIGAGFGRTGTLSLKLALEELGLGPCHHMYEVRRSPRLTALWTAVTDGAPPDWDQIFTGYASQVDWPAAAFWRDLIAHFPQAKVILTVRDPEAWYASIVKTILPASVQGRMEDPEAIGRAGSDIIYRIALKGIFQDRLTDKAHALDVYARHQRDVIAAVPADRLLVYDVKEGWDPLCRFLDLDVPGTPFPRSNSTDEFLARKPYLATDRQD
jgi:Sulfotransferase domain